MRLLAILLAAALASAGVSPVGRADPPTSAAGSFSTAKRWARDRVYFDHRETFYCGCRFAPSETASGGLVGHIECGYETRRNAARAARLEWEHLMPAHRFGGDRACWREGHERCDRDGRPYAGRACCARSGVDPEFRLMENDLHNLVPAVGEVNGDRSNHPAGIVDGEPRLYGACDFELGGEETRAEATEDRRGDLARAYLYMAETYGIALTDAERSLLSEWSAADRPDDMEILRNRRISAIQGNANPFIPLDGGSGQ